MEKSENPNEAMSNNNKGGGLMKGKSCKGCLYYSSVLNSKSRDPFCVGLSRTLQNVPGNIVRETKLEASEEDRNLTDFKYACIGYSVKLDRTDSSAGSQEKQVELPFCLGIEVLVDKRASTANHGPGHDHRGEDGQVTRRPGPYKPAHSTGEEFFGRFTRNASIVASGVARNMQRVGNYVKANLDDMLYPYRKRPK